MQHLYLIGFMGAGKSTIGQIIASRLGLPFIDLDARIVEQERMSINAIFASQGEAYFRDLEAEALRSLSARPPSVVATGGGVVGREENLAAMKATGTTVYLDVEWDVVVSRLRESSDRPLARSDENWSGPHKLFRDRLPQYQKADFRVEAGQKSPDVIASEIIDRLKRCHELS